MQLDVFVPKLSLGFEYQGEQHYFDVYQMGAQWRYVERDEQKRKACKENRISLIEVPYWWDCQTETLKATIHEKRPELFPEPTDATPIPKMAPFK